jgi:hypothetical protein
MEMILILKEEDNKGGGAYEGKNKAVVRKRLNFSSPLIGINNLDF